MMTPRPSRTMRRLDGYCPPDLVNTLITALRSDVYGNPGRSSFCGTRCLAQTTHSWLTMGKVSAGSRGVLREPAAETRFGCFFWSCRVATGDPAQPPGRACTSSSDQTRSRPFARLDRLGVEQLVRQQSCRLLAQLGLERDTHQRALILDRRHPPRQIGTAARRAETAAVGPDCRQPAGAGHHIMAADKPGNKGTGRTLKDVARRASLADLSVIHHDHQIGQCHGLVLAMRDMHKGDAEIAAAAASIPLACAPGETDRAPKAARRAIGRAAW